MAWVFERAEEVWFFANARNRASLELHARLGFVEVTRDFAFPASPSTAESACCAGQHDTSHHLGRYKGKGSGRHSWLGCPAHGLIVVR
jgi:hypothetical protein